MAERIEAIKVTLNQSLNDKEKPWKKFFDLAEAKSGVPRVYLLAGEYEKLHIIFFFFLSRLLSFSKFQSSLSSCSIFSSFFSLSNFAIKVIRIFGKY